ncbi:MAG: PKD domain-containing protein, partial [Candidatus Thermoplasmatota archaeon]
EGKYNVKVSVSNGYITSDATIEINIASAVNLPPKAVIKKPILKVAYVGEKLEFDASGSSDPEGADLTFSWDFGDGNNATGKIVEHKYTKKGKYIVKLKVSDGVNTNTTSKEIEVKEKPKVCMIAFIVPIALLMLVRVLPGRRKT